MDSSFARRAAPLALIALFFVAAPAFAERRDVPTAGKEQEAREHYKQGMLHFDLGEVDLAIQEFRQAYAISAAPGLLFNIAQAYRVKKDYEQALHFYRTYLRLQPKAPNRVDVEARVAEMEKMVKDQEQLAKERPIGVIPPGARVANESPPAPGARVVNPTIEGTPQGDGTPEPAVVAPLKPAVVVAAPPRPRFLATTRGKVTIALAAVGAVSLITAAALGGVALSTRNDYRSGCDRGACDDGKYDRARGLAIGTDVLIGVGAASAIGALVLGLTTRASLQRGVYAGASGGGLVWGSF